MTAPKALKALLTRLIIRPFRPITLATRLAWGRGSVQTDAPMCPKIVLVLDRLRPTEVTPGTESALLEKPTLDSSLLTPKLISAFRVVSLTPGRVPAVVLVVVLSTLCIVPMLELQHSMHLVVRYSTFRALLCVVMTRSLVSLTRLSVRPKLFRLMDRRVLVVHLFVRRVLLTICRIDR